jgi:hypothetical protein
MTASPCISDECTVVAETADRVCLPASLVTIPMPVAPVTQQGVRATRSHHMRAWADAGLRRGPRHRADRTAPEIVAHGYDDGAGRADEVIVARKAQGP